MMPAIPHFDRVTAEITKVLSKSAALEPEDKAQVRNALQLFERLETEYHGEDEEVE